MNSKQAIRAALSAIEEELRRLGVARLSLINLLDDDAGEIVNSNEAVSRALAVSNGNQPVKVIEIDNRIEQLFKGASNWTVSEVSDALGLNPDQRGTAWNAVSRLVAAGKVRMVKPGAGRRAALYSWVQNGRSENVTE